MNLLLIAILTSVAATIEYTVNDVPINNCDMFKNVENKKYIEVEILAMKAEKQLKALVISCEHFYAGNVFLVDSNAVSEEGKFTNMTDSHKVVEMTEFPIFANVKNMKNSVFIEVEVADQIAKIIINGGRIVEINRTGFETYIQNVNQNASAVLFIELSSIKFFQSKEEMWYGDGKSIKFDATDHNEPSHYADVVNAVLNYFFDSGKTAEREEYIVTSENKERLKRRVI